MAEQNPISRHDFILGRLLSWVRMLGPLGVLLGVILVLYQVGQTNNLARLSLYTEIDLNRQQVESNVLGENFSETLAKLRVSPDSVTDAELYQFQSYADAVVRQFNLYFVLRNAGLFTVDWRIYIRNQICQYFDHEVGRAYLEWQTREGSIVDRELNDSVQSCVTENKQGYVDFVRSKLN